LIRDKVLPARLRSTSGMPCVTPGKAVPTNNDFAGSPLNPLDLDALKQQMRDAPAFPHFCIDNFLKASFAAAVRDAFPSYDEAARLGRSFDAVNEERKIQITEAARFPAPIRRLHELLASDAFVAQLSEMSGIAGLVADPKLSGGGIHETNHGGRLDVHIDFNFNPDLGLYRRLNLLVYFNTDWQDAYGGVLDLWDADVKHCVGRYAPSFNRAAGFATSDHSWHGVTPVTCPPNVMRKSFAVYYYTREAPPGCDGVVHSTIFRARPDEHWKGGVAMPVERLVRATGRGLDTLKGRIKRRLT
jgi:2OG-Fe(II) oxygenase superfamily